MDQIMETWEQQLKSPGGAFKFPEAWADDIKIMPGMSAMPGVPSMPGMPPMPGFGMFPGFGGAGGMPGFGQFPGASGMPANPMQFWMQTAEVWQKAWQQAFQSWMEAQSKMTGKGR